jgi:hypothetical protein
MILSATNITTKITFTTNCCKDNIYYKYANYTKGVKTYKFVHSHVKLTKFPNHKSRVSNTILHVFN